MSAVAAQCHAGHAPGRHSRGPCEAEASGVSETHEHVAVAGERRTPAAEHQAAQLWQGGHQLRGLAQPCFVELDALAAGAVAGLR